MVNHPNRNAWTRSGDGYERREKADHWDTWTNVRWPGVISYRVWRKRSGGWGWNTAHLSRDEREYGAGDAATLTEAKKQALAAADNAPSAS